MSVDLLDFDVAPYRLSGTVYGTLLNSALALKDLGETVNEPPYKGAPKAPVLYLKPRNTLARSGDVLEVPASPGELEIGASLGLVIGRTACRVSEEAALDYQIPSHGRERDRACRRRRPFDARRGDGPRRDAANAQGFGENDQ